MGKDENHCFRVFRVYGIANKDRSSQYNKYKITYGLLTIYAGKAAIILLKIYCLPVKLANIIYYIYVRGRRQGSRDVLKSQWILTCNLIILIFY